MSFPLEEYPHVDKDAKTRDSSSKERNDWRNSVEQRAREAAVGIEVHRALQAQVSECVRAYPITHYHDCKEIVQKYVKMLKDPLKGATGPAAAED